MRAPRTIVIACLLLCATAALAQNVPAPRDTQLVDLQPTVAWAGISVGIAGANAPDIVAFINDVMGYGAIEVNAFATAAQFGAFGARRFGDDWALGLSYSYIAKSYTFPGADITTTADYSYDLHIGEFTVDRIFTDTSVIAGAGISAGMIAGVFRRTPPGEPSTMFYRAAGGTAGLHLFFLTPLSERVCFRVDLAGRVTFSGAMATAQGLRASYAHGGQTLDATFQTVSGTVTFGVAYRW